MHIAEQMHAVHLFGTQRTKSGTCLSYVSVWHDTQAAWPPDCKAHDDAKAPGDSVQAGTRFRLRRGVLGSAEQLSAAQAMDHPEALSHVGWYLQAHLGRSCAISQRAMLLTEFTNVPCMRTWCQYFHYLCVSQRAAAGPALRGTVKQISGHPRPHSC